MLRSRALAILVGNCGIFRRRRGARPAAGPAQTRPGDMQAGSLLLKGTEDGGYVEAPRLGTDIDITVSGPTVARPRHPDLPATRPTGLGRGDLRLPAARGRRGRHPEDGDRRPRRRSARSRSARRRAAIYEQAKAAGQQGDPASSRSGPTSSPTRSPISARARPCWCRSNTRSRCAKSGDSSRCACRWSSRRATIPKPVVQTVDFVPTASGWGTRRRSRCRIATASRRRCSIRATHAPVNPVPITVRLQAGFALGEVKSHHHAVTIESRRGRHARDQARRGPGPGRPRLRADLEARRRHRAVGRACSASASATADYLLAYRDAAGTAAGRRTSRPREIDLRDRQFRLDGRHLDGAGQGEPRSTRSAACSRPTASTSIRFDDTMDVLFPTAVAGRRRATSRRAKGFVARARGAAAAPRCCRR